MRNSKDLPASYVHNEQSVSLQVTWPCKNFEIAFRRLSGDTAETPV